MLLIQVGAVKDSMTTAKLYLSAPVVDRLTRPVTAYASRTAPATADGSRSAVKNRRPNRSIIPQHDAAEEAPRVLLDVSAFMEAISGSDISATLSGDRSRKRPSSAPRERSVRSSYSYTSTSSHDDDDPFSQFLNRQSQLQLRRQSSVARVERELTPNFTPSIPRTSRSQFAHDARGSEFLERMEADSIRRRDPKRLEATAAATTEAVQCTFKPQVTARSAAVPARSPDSMSQGDLLRKQVHQKFVKLRTEQESLKGVTFQPEISRYAQLRGKGALHISDAHLGESNGSESDGKSFLDVHREKQLQKEWKRELELRKRSASELQECTFKPETRDCPNYIKRIAKSVQVVKSAKSRDATAAQEEASRSTAAWR